MTTFGEYQSSMASQMRERLTSSRSGGAEEMASAAQNLNMTATLSARQAQQTASTIEQQGMQIQQLTQSVQQLVLQMRMSAQQAFNDAPRPVDVLGPTGARAYGGVHAMANIGMQAGRFGAGAAGSFAMGQARGLYGAARSTYRNTVYPFAPVPHGFGGEVAAGHMTGAIPTFMHGMGSYYNPATMQQGTFGAYQRGIAHQLGGRTQNLAQGAFGALSSVFNFSNVGGFLGDKVIPIPLVGSMIGSKLFEPLDVFNPISYASNQVGRANFFGAQAQTAAQGFLRGRDAFQTGRFNMGEEARIGQAMRKFSNNDLTFSDKDIAGMQQSFAMTGQMVGVQNVDDYVRRMKQQIDTAKMVMKIANVASSQASEIMADARQIMGLKSGAQTQGILAQVGAMAPMAGLSYGQMFQSAVGGAQSYAGAGMYAQLGARMGITTRAIAGFSSERMSASDLANVGGEDGVARVIAETTQKYLQGFGGTLIAAGGRGYGSFGSGITRAVGGLQSSGDMVGFMANKNERLTDATQGMGTFGVQIQQARDLMQMTKEFRGVGGSDRDRAKLLAKSMYGIGGAEATALLDSMVNLEGSIGQAQRLGQRQFQDALRDQIQEGRGFSSRMRLGYRRGMERLSGGMADRVSSFAADAGEYVSSRALDMYDSHMGVEKRYVSQDVAQQIADTKSFADMDSGGKTGSGRASMMAMSQSLAHVKDIGSPTAQSIEQLVKGANKQGGLRGATMMGAAAWALRTGRRYDTGQELVSDYMDAVSADPSQASTKSDVMNMASLTGVDESVRSGMAEKLGVTGEVDPLANKETLIKELRSTLGDEVTSDSELLGVAGSQTAKMVIKGLQELYRMYEPGSDKQSEAYNKKALELGQLIQNIQDPGVKKLVERLMSQSGAKVGASGMVDFTGTVNMMREQSGFSKNIRSMKRTVDRVAIDSALKDYSAQKSIEEIAKTNPMGAEYLKSNPNVERMDAGFLSSGVGYTESLMTAAEDRSVRESKAKALTLGLSTLGERGSALQVAATAALGTVDTNNATFSAEAMAGKFASMSDEEILALSKSKDQTEVKIAEYAAAAKTGQLTTKDAGNAMAALIAKRGNMSGTVVEGDAAAKALQEGLLGSDSMRAMLNQQQMQVESMRLLYEELKRLRD